MDFIFFKNIYIYINHLINRLGTDSLRSFESPSYSRFDTLYILKNDSRRCACGHKHNRSFIRYETTVTCTPIADIIGTVITNSARLPSSTTRTCSNLRSDCRNLLLFVRAHCQRASRALYSRLWLRAP